VFKEYLKEVWVDLTSRSEEKKGINKLTFASYYQLPGIISLYLFNVFDKKNKGYITIKEFLKGMVTLFCEDFDKNSRFIFNFYDNDKDGLISKEDIRTVLSYVTLNNNENHNENINENNKENNSNNNIDENLNINNCNKDNNLNNIHNLYLQRVHSQEELYKLLEISFKHINKEKINYEEFLYIIENIASDIYMIILLFLLEKKPFKKFGINEYKKQKLPLNSPKTKRNSINSKLIASPVANQKNSCFSSSKIFIRESKKRKTISMTMNNIDKQKLLKGFMENEEQKTRKRGFTLKGMTYETLNKFLKQTMKKNFIENNDSNNNSNNISEDENDNQNNNNNEHYFLHYYSHDEDDNVPVTRKTKTDLKHINEEGLSRKVRTIQEKYNDIQLMPAYKQNESNNNDNNKNNNKGSNEVSESCGSIFSDEKNNIYNINSNSSLFNFHDNSDSFSSSSSSSNSDSEKDILTFEGNLYKMIDNKKLKRLYFKLIHKDLYFFKNEKEKSHKGMHNLSGVFINENSTSVFNEMTFYSFSLIFPSKTRVYYTPNKTDYENWVSKLKEATGYTNLMDLYEIGKKLGNGKFGLVKRGLNKKNKKRSRH
jgi:hypothetical protein